MIKKVITIAIVAVLGYFGYKQFSEKNTSQTIDKAENVINTNTNNTNSEKVVGVAMPGTNYKDGNYNIPANYVSPGGKDSFTVTFQIKDGAIVGTNMSPNPSNETSKKFQTGFMNTYNPIVVGQKIDNLNLNTVAGASLTTAAFNKAVVELKTKARI